MPRLRGCFQGAGHILGSAGVRLEFAKSNGRTPSVFFAGDLGRPDKASVRDPSPVAPCDTPICENTYPDRRNESPDEAKKELVRVLRRTYGRRGKVIVPALSVGLTQSMAYRSQEEAEIGHIPPRQVLSATRRRWTPLRCSSCTRNATMLRRED